MTVGWHDGGVVDAQALYVLEASGARAALAAFSEQDGAPAELRAEARVWLKLIGRGVRACVAASSQSRSGEAGASSARVELSRSEVALMIGCSEQWVSELLDREELAGRKVGRQWLIEQGSVNEYLARQGDR